MLRLNQRGDTIVEVMIVLAVLGFALSIAYATANRALLNTRQAQETAEATKLAETQIEMLRALAPDDFKAHDQTNIYLASRTGPTAAFCIGSGYYSPYTIYDYATGKKSPNDANPDPADNPCKQQGRVNKLYDQQITFNSVDNTFAVLVSWPNIRGDGIDTVKMSYRVYPNGQ